jgi:hypothetical protein
VRFALTLVLWLATTAALAVLIPATWLQKDVVDVDGYAALARTAAADPALQSAMTGELATRAMALIAERGGGSVDGAKVDGAKVHDAIAAFTAGPAFPPLFVDANKAAHSWLFGSPQSRRDGDQWVVDLAPMLNESSVKQMLSNYEVKVPTTLTVPLTVSVPGTSRSLRQGQLNRLETWGPWGTIGVGAATALCGFLLLVAARSRGKALTSIGVSVLLIGGMGWAAIEVAGRRVDTALNGTTGDIRQVAEVMIRHAEASMHQWLNLTLVGGAALVGLGLVVAVIGSLRKRD